MANQEDPHASCETPSVPKRFERRCRTPEDFAAVWGVSARSVREWVKAGMLPGCTEPRILVCNYSLSELAHSRFADEFNRKTGPWKGMSRTADMIRNTVGPDGPWNWRRIVTELLRHHGEERFHRLLIRPFPEDEQWLDELRQGSEMRQLLDGPELRGFLSDKERLILWLCGVDLETAQEIRYGVGEAVDSRTLERWQSGRMRPNAKHRRRLLRMFSELTANSPLGKLPITDFQRPDVAEPLRPYEEKAAPPS